MFLVNWQFCQTSLLGNHNSTVCRTTNQYHMVFVPIVWQDFCLRCKFPLVSLWATIIWKNSVGNWISWEAFSFFRLHTFWYSYSVKLETHQILNVALRFNKNGCCHSKDVYCVHYETITHARRMFATFCTLIFSPKQTTNFSHIFTLCK